MIIAHKYFRSSGATIQDCIYYMKQTDLLLVALLSFKCISSIRLAIMVCVRNEQYTNSLSLSINIIRIFCCIFFPSYGAQVKMWLDTWNHEKIISIKIYLIFQYLSSNFVRRKWFRKKIEKHVVLQNVVNRIKQ